MVNRSSRSLSWLIPVLLMMIHAQPTASAAAPAATRPAASAQKPDLDPSLPTLWIVGDSTVRNNTPGQKGWGDPIADLFDRSRIHVVNRAIGGRSSRTFQTEGRWQQVLDDAKPGDFVLIQFGHNDGIAPDDPKRPRGTLRGSGEETKDIIHPDTKQPETVHTFGWYMRKYAADAKARGMTPIIVSLIPRCPRPGAEHPAPPKAPGGYVLWSKEAAEAEGAAFIDLHARVMDLYNEMTPEQIKSRYFCEADYTHTNAEGARKNAEIVAEGIRELPNCPLANYLKRESQR